MTRPADRVESQPVTSEKPARAYGCAEAGIDRDSILSPDTNPASMPTPNQLWRHMRCQRPQCRQSWGLTHRPDRAAPEWFAHCPFCGSWRIELVSSEPIVATAEATALPGQYVAMLAQITYGAAQEIAKGLPPPAWMAALHEALDSMYWLAVDEYREQQRRTMRPDQEGSGRRTQPNPKPTTTCEETCRP